jgi:hypothetical protein
MPVILDTQVAEIRMISVQSQPGQIVHSPYPEKLIRKKGWQDAPPLTNGLRKCGIYTQWNFMQP